jgi:hypothetical protein
MGDYAGANPHYRRRMGQKRGLLRARVKRREWSKRKGLKRKKREI